MENQENGKSGGQGSPDVTPLTREQYEEMTVKELKALLEGTDFDPKTRKAGLVDLLAGSKKEVIEVKPEKKKAKIGSQKAAEKFAKEFKTPPKNKTAYVSGDGYMFFESSHGSAFNHCKRKGVELYTIKL